MLKGFTNQPKEDPLAKEGTILVILEKNMLYSCLGSVSYIQLCKLCYFQSFFIFTDFCLFLLVTVQVTIHYSKSMLPEKR